MLNQILAHHLCVYIIYIYGDLVFSGDLIKLLIVVKKASVSSNKDKDIYEHCSRLLYYFLVSEKCVTK